MGKKIRQKIRIFELLPSEYSEIRILKNDRILQTLVVVAQDCCIYPQLTANNSRIISILV